MYEAWAVCIEEEDYKLFANSVRIPCGSSVVQWCEERKFAYCYICKDRQDAENSAYRLNAAYRRNGIALYTD